MIEEYDIIVDAETDEPPVVIHLSDEVLGPPEEKLQDLVVEVNGDGGPIAGVNVFYLPEEWIGERFRVIRNGLKFYDWALDESGEFFVLTKAGDLWLNEGIKPEQIALENY